jgi:hypothetical protein
VEPIRHAWSIWIDLHTVRCEPPACAVDATADRRSHSVGSRRDALVPMAALGAAMIALLHPCIDFSLQIPRYAIVVFGLMRLGLSSIVVINPRGTVGNDSKSGKERV